MIEEDHCRFVSFLQTRLSQERLEHSIGVMRIMRELAEVYGLDSDKAQTAGLLHDAAKDLSLGAQLALAERAQITFTDPCERPPVYLHAPVSAYLVSSELGITDLMILNAIATHSYSADGEDSGMSFARCLRGADVLAPIQEWKGMRKLRDTIFAGKIAEAALLQCGWLIEYKCSALRSIPLCSGNWKHCRANWVPLPPFSRDGNYLLSLA